MPPVSVISIFFRISEVSPSVPTHHTRFSFLWPYQLVFSTTLAILTGTFHHNHSSLPPWIKIRFLYTFVTSILGIVFSLLFIVNQLSLDISLVYLIDFILFALFIAAFGVVGDFVIPMICDPVWSWHELTGLGTCGRFKAEVTLAFLVGACFFLSGLLVSYISCWEGEIWMEADVRW